MIPPSTERQRTIYHADALAWLKDQKPLAGAAFITSLPDISEFPNFSLEEWKLWFIKAAALVMSRCADSSVTVFYQTDIKRDRIWVDKSYLCQKAAELSGHSLIGHKVICRAPPGDVRYGRPAYSHLLFFSKSVRPEIAKALPDVLPTAGPATWTRGMGLEACRLACRFVMTHTEANTIVDPFCGHGTVLAVANELGLKSIGVELSRKRAKIAESLRIEKDQLHSGR